MAPYVSKIVADLRAMAEREPLKVVLIDRGRNFSAGELFDQSKALASNLLRNTFSADDVCVMAVEPGFDFLVLVYGLLMLNAQIAIIDPEMGAQNYAAKLSQLKPSWIFVDSRLLFLDDHPLLKKFLRKIRKGIPQIGFNIKAKKVAVGRRRPFQRKYLNFSSLLMKCWEQEINNKEDTKTGRIIVYTSGTVDVPKGVVHTNDSMGSSIDRLSEIIGADRNDVVGTYLPHFMLLGIATGLNVKTMSNRMSATEKLDWFAKENINIFFGPPSELLPLLVLCEKNQTLFPSSLKHLMIGSAPVHQSFLKRLLKVLPRETRITCTYGMTENLLVSLADGRAKAEYEGHGDLLGKIVTGVEVKISEDREICVRSPQLFERYFHEKSRPDWHATGDLGQFNERGELVLLGRKKEMIIRRDFNIYPALYEGIIKKIPGINETALVGLYKEELQDEKVYLALETDLPNTHHIMKQLSSGTYSIDKEALPDAIITMKIPRKGRQNKIDRKAILEYIQRNNL